MISFKQRGNFNRTMRFLKRMKDEDYDDLLELYAQRGVEALRARTPRETGLTAESWRYEIVKDDGKTTIYWLNDNMAGEVSVALLIQYGHATKSGTWVQGFDYINPAMKDTFDKIAEDIWREVNRS